MKRFFRKHWTLFWYNKVTRILLILLGGDAMLAVLLLRLYGLEGEVVRSAAIAVYVSGFIWAMEDNNFSKRDEFTKI